MGDQFCHQIASLLLPYLEAFDENAINNFSNRLKCFGISLDASPITTSPLEHRAGSRLTFTKVAAQPPFKTDPALYATPPPFDFEAVTALHEAGLAQLQSCQNATEVLCTDSFPWSPFIADQNMSQWLEQPLHPVIVGDSFLAHDFHSAEPQAPLPLLTRRSLSPRDEVLDAWEHDSCRPRKSQRRSKQISSRPCSRDGVSQASTHSSPASIRSLHTPLIPGLAELQCLYGLDTKYNLSDQVLRETLELSRHCIHPDIIEHLQGALHRWKTSGFWLQEKLPEPGSKTGTGREKLFNAYSYICKLENRIGDDQIRNRVAGVMLHTAYEQACKEWRYCGTQKPKGKGRGDATTVIDDILEELHGDWHQAGRQQQLRSRFHDKKRFGKRWLILTRKLGMSILIVCSSKIASAVHTTVFTAGMLEALAYCIEWTEPLKLQMLQALNPIVTSLLQSEDCGNINVDQTLDLIRSLQFSDGAGQLGLG